MKKIIFATSNKRKFGEAELGCSPYGINIEMRTLDIDEIQHTDPLKISEHKARTAFEIVGKPVVVTDTFWAIPSLKGFPGAYMKEVTEWFTEQDFLNLLQDKDDKRVMFSENISYFDGTTLKQFHKDFWGRIVSPRQARTPVSIENIAEFDGKTIAENRQAGGFSHKAEDFVWTDFAKWYSKLK